MNYFTVSPIYFLQLTSCYNLLLHGSGPKNCKSSIVWKNNCWLFFPSSCFNLHYTILVLRGGGNSSMYHQHKDLAKQHHQQGPQYKQIFSWNQFYKNFVKLISRKFCEINFTKISWNRFYEKIFLSKREKPHLILSYNEGPDIISMWSQLQAPRRSLNSHSKIHEFV